MTLTGWDARLARDVDDYWYDDQRFDGVVDVYSILRVDGRTYRVHGTLTDAWEADSIDLCQLCLEQLDALSVWVPLDWDNEIDDALLDAVSALCETRWQHVWDDCDHDDNEPDIDALMSRQERNS